MEISRRRPCPAGSSARPLKERATLSGISACAVAPSTNLNEYDPKVLDIGSWVDYWSSLKLDPAPEI
jgi:hypothetical protein